MNFNFPCQYVFTTYPLSHFTFFFSIHDLQLKTNEFVYDDMLCFPLNPYHWHVVLFTVLPTQPRFGFCMHNFLTYPMTPAWHHEIQEVRWYNNTKSNWVPHISDGFTAMEMLLFDKQWHTISSFLFYYFNHIDVANLPSSLFESLSIFHSGNLYKLQHYRCGNDFRLSLLILWSKFCQPGINANHVITIAPRILIHPLSRLRQVSIFMS